MAYITDAQLAEVVGRTTTKLNELNLAAAAAFRGGLAIADTPSGNGFWLPTESGTYTNAGSIVVDLTDGLTVLAYDGTTWSDVVVPIDLSAYAQTEYVTKELGLKSNKRFSITSTFDNKANVNNTNPFWPNSNVATPFRYVQFNFKALSKMILKSLDFAGAYITTDLTLGTGNVSLRIYKGVTINGSYVSDFTDAELLRKVSIPIAEFYDNATKAANSADLKTALQAGDIGYTTFDFTPLEIEKDEVLHFYFGADDDTYYQNSPNPDAPTMRISLSQSSSAAMISTAFSQDSPSTFMTTVQARLTNNTAYPLVVIKSLKETSDWNDGVISVDTRNIYTFVGAMNFVLDALFTAKPLARVLIISHHTISGRTLTGQSADYFKPLLEVQQRVADYWGANYLPLWNKLNWKNNGAGNLNTYKNWVPDEVHPYSNPVEVSTIIGDMSIADYIIHDFVKEALRPIFGDDWAGKKVATYGTSIPYGGKYTILAAEELGGEGFNYCSSGSYLRRGGTDEVPVANSFTDDESVNRNYQADMLDLIGTADEPDLFVFDFGINDYNLDRSDFDITY